MAAQSGIGIKLSAADSNLRIDGVMDRGPAFNAGIRAGWYLVSIDGLDVSQRAPNSLQPLLLGAAGSIVSLGISRERGGALESFEVERNYNSSILGHNISEHQEMHLQHNLVRHASSLLVSHASVGSALPSHSARSPAAAPLLVRANTAPYTAAAVTASSLASEVTVTAVESQKQFSPALSAFVAPSKRLQDSWSELKNEQLQRATRCCSELLQRASYNTRHIDALKALCKQQQRDLQEAKAEAAAALSRLAASERSSWAVMSAAAAPLSGAASVPNGEVLMLKSLLSRAEIDKRKLQLQLDIKIAENKELARACEDLRSGVGNLSPMTLSPREMPP